MAHSRPGARQSVLIADADSDHVAELAERLRAAGVKNPFVAFSDDRQLRGYLTRAVIGAEDERPCVLFLDPRLPGTNGFETIRWMQREPALQEVKVVIFSDTNYPEEIESAGDLGVHLFLKKHPDLSSLSTIVSHLCGVDLPERQPWRVDSP